MSQLSTHPESSYPGISPPQISEPSPLADLARKQLSDAPKLAWAATRLDQKLASLNDSASLWARFSHLRRRTLLLVVCTAVCAGFAVQLMGQSLIIDALLFAPTLLFGLLGLSSLTDDLFAIARHRQSSPEGLFRSFFRAVTRGDYSVGYRLLTQQDHNNVIRPTPRIPGTIPRDSHTSTFDSVQGFAGYWEETVAAQRPVRWEDSHAGLTNPVRWVSFNQLKTKRLGKRLSLVSAEVVWHHLPHWAGFSSLLGVIPALFLIPQHYRTVRLKVVKVAVLSKGGWFLVNGELISTEDVVASKLSR